MKRLISLAIVLTVVVPIHAQPYGRFIGRVVAQWNPDGRSMTLTEDFAYVDPTGVIWNAPRGSVIDGASIPTIAWPIIGGAFEGKYRDASVIHDVACVMRTRPWQYVHLAFYNAMLASGVESARAKIMYMAVFGRGPRWDPPGEVRGGGPSSPQLSEEEFNRRAQYIEQRERSGRPLTLQEIRDLAIQ